MKKNERQVLVGVGGWEHEVFDRCFYPAAGFDPLRKLTAFAESFDFVEIRPTFWDDTLGARDAAEWVSAVAGNPRFQFGVKLHRSITHGKELSPGVTRRTRSVLQELAKAGRLGAVVAQFPYSFTNTGANRFYLTKLGEVFSGFPVFTELRHGSWDVEGLSDMLEELQLLPVNVDLPRLKQYITFRTDTGSEATYLRLHGRNEKGWLVNAVDARYDYLYNERELRELKRRIDRLAGKTGSVVVVFNNTTGAKGLANALQLEHALHEGERMRSLPQPILETFPFLRSVAEPETNQAALPIEPGLRRAM